MNSIFISVHLITFMSVMVYVVIHVNKTLLCHYQRFDVEYGIYSISETGFIIFCRKLSMNENIE